MRHFTPTPNPSPAGQCLRDPIKREGLKYDTISITPENSPSLILGEGAGGWGL